MGSLIGFKSKAKDKTFHSGLEEAVATQLKARGVAFVHEPQPPVEYDVPERPSKFTPTFVLPNGIIVHTFRRLVLADRKKLMMIRDQHPTLDLRLVFVNSLSRVVKGGKATYGDWCRRMGFIFADKSIPQSWITEVLPAESLAAVRALKPKVKR